MGAISSELVAAKHGGTKPGAARVALIPLYRGKTIWGAGEYRSDRSGMQPVDGRRATAGDAWRLSTRVPVRSVRGLDAAMATIRTKRCRAWAKLACEGRGALRCVLLMQRSCAGVGLWHERTPAAVALAGEHRSEGSSSD